MLKNKSTIDYLGCSADFLYNYINNKLTEEMKIKGYDIDHIKPISKFNIFKEEELKQCLHYTNLRPLLSIDNKKKSNKWTKEDEIEWKNLLPTRVSTNLIVQPTMFV